MERANKIPYDIVRAGSHGGVEIFYDHFIFQIHRSGGIQNHPPGRVNNPNSGRQISI